MASRKHVVTPQAPALDGMTPLGLPPAPVATPEPADPTPGMKSNQTVRFEDDNVGRRMTWTFEALPDAPTVAYTYRAPFGDESACDYLLYKLGVKQKVGDGTAKRADPKTGRTDAQVKYDTVRAIVDALAAGVFSRVGASAAPRVATVADLTAAIAVARGKTDRAALATLVGSWTEAQRAAWQAKPDVATALYDLYRARAGSVAEADESGLDAVA